MLAPLIPEVMKDFGSTSEAAASFTVTSYILGFCFGPLLLAPMSELYGRSTIYHVCNTGFLVFTVACAVSPNVAALCTFRFFAGAFGASPMAIGGATVADVMSQHERGRAVAVVTLATLFVPAVGPVIGSYLGAAKGWRSIFWCLAIAVRVFHPKPTYLHAQVKKALTFEINTGGCCYSGNGRFAAGNP